MKNPLKIFAVLAALGFIGMQFIRPELSNPPVVPAQTLESSMNVPPEVGTLLSRSCSDCHSNRTVYPWYSQIAPPSWLLAEHVREGRAELNFDDWGTYKLDRKIRKLDEICEMVTSGEMPLPSYLWLHGDATLNAAQRQLLCDWANAERVKLTSDRPVSRTY
jgi:hypothetical protein